MATKTTPDAAPEQAQAAPVQTPAQGGSYLVDQQTGEHRLVERTQPSAGRAAAATSKE